MAMRADVMDMTTRVRSAVVSERWPHYPTITSAMINRRIIVVVGCGPIPTPPIRLIAVATVNGCISCSIIAIAWISVAVARVAISNIARAVSISAGGATTDYSGSNQSGSNTRSPAPSSPPCFGRRG